MTRRLRHPAPRERYSDLMLRTRAWAAFWGINRLVFVGLIVAAIVGQLIRSVSISVENGWPVVTTVIDFFSYFTILSNSASAVVLAIGAVFAFSARRVDPRWFAVLLLCVTTYMVITGIVYNLLLRNVPVAPGATVGWSNDILHVAAPAFFALDLLLGPQRRALNWGTIGTAIIFPIVWLVYTLVRAPLVTDFRTGNPYWYPYPFLNPNIQPWGYGGVALYIVGIAAGITAVAALAVWIGRLRGRGNTEDEIQSDAALPAAPAI